MQRVYDLVQRVIKRMGQSQSIQGGWQSAEKSDPELWKKVLKKWEATPGPWAAWKAKKAIDMYQKLGGKYINKK